MRTHLALLTGAMLSFAPLQSAIAVDPETLLLLTDPLANPLELDLLEPGAVVPSGIITSQTISQEGLTLPSLWWTDEQFGEKLLDNWVAYPGTDGTPRRVDLVVNQQVWSLYTYVERYTFVNHFGVVAKEYGYNMRVFNRQQDFLAAYICDFNNAEDLVNVAPEAIAERTSQVDCAMFLDPSGQGGLQGGSANPFGGSQSTTPGTAQP